MLPSVALAVALVRSPLHGEWHIAAKRSYVPEGIDLGIRDHAVYSASKGGVHMLTKVLALEWSNRGVTVNAIAPTFIRTPGTAERLDDPEISAGILERIPIGHVGTTTDVASAVMYLASPAGGMVTGHVLVVDGGWTAQ